MKKSIIITLFFTLVACVAMVAQVNCSLTLITTIQNFNVYQHNPSGAILFRAKMSIDADGSPRAYGPNNSGLDYTANAGSPGNWWGVVTDNNGNPVVQGSGDPYPGMYVSTTSLINSSYGSSNPLRYVDSEAIPFFVLPSALVQLGNISIGDVGYVQNSVTGQGCYAYFADGGPAGKLGEGSIYLASQTGVNPNARTGGTSLGIIDYVVFPGSGSGQGVHKTIAQINSMGATAINTVGGTGITACLNSPSSTTCGTPTNLTAGSITTISATLSWSAVSGATSYNIQYKESLSSIWTSVVSTNTTETLNTLIPATSYQYKVQAICAVSGTYTSLETFNTIENVAPTTAISIANNWQNSNFTAMFTDADNSGGSGLEKSYYQVIDYNGTEWHANSSNGFFADNFDSFNAPVWSVPSGSGSWQVTGGELLQQDSSVNNSNIYASLDQNLSNRYLYQFYAKMDAATYGTSQHRFGFHFFSDNAALSNRGNSYFMFVRQETSAIEIYKVVNNVFTLSKTISNVVTAFGQGYDYKIIFDRSTGKIDIYRDNSLLGSWTDSGVLTTSGDYVSFRTGNCKVSINELNVYRSRAASVIVAVGAGATNDIRYQNPSPTAYSGKIKSIVNDTAGNLSTIAYENINVDWSDPFCAAINDGVATDFDTTNSFTTLSANWAAAADSNSAIIKYWYAIGTSAGATDVVGWTDNNLATSVTESSLALTLGQTYYVSVKAENAAGLNSICSTDGILAEVFAGIAEKESNILVSAQPNPFNENATLFFSQKTDQQITITLTDILGKEMLLTNKTYPAGKHSVDINTDELRLAKGLYTLRITSIKFVATLKLIKY